MSTAPQIIALIKLEENTVLKNTEYLQATTVITAVIKQLHRKLYFKMALSGKL